MIPSVETAFLQRRDRLRHQTATKENAPPIKAGHLMEVHNTSDNLHIVVLLITGLAILPITTSPVHYSSFTQ
mgnify:CR=1 FL=1